MCHWLRLLCLGVHRGNVLIHCSIKFFPYCCLSVQDLYLTWFIERKVVLKGSIVGPLFQG